MFPERKPGPYFHAREQRPIKPNGLRRLPNDVFLCAAAEGALSPSRMMNMILRNGAS